MYTPGETVQTIFSTSSKFWSTCPWKKRHCRRNQFPQKCSLRRTLNEWHLNKPRSRCVQVKCAATCVQGCCTWTSVGVKILNITIETNSSGVCSFTWANSLAKYKLPCKNNRPTSTALIKSPLQWENIFLKTSFVDQKPLCTRILVMEQSFCWSSSKYTYAQTCL